MEKRRVVALARVSSEEQASDGKAGIERQWRDIEAIAARDNLEIVQRFQLEGVSGSTVKLNPKFQKMLEVVEKPGIAGLVISSPDRLMRCHDLSDLAVLQPFGKEDSPRLIWTAESIYNLQKFDSQLMFVVQTLAGGHEKKQIIARTQAGKNISRERADKCADKPPVGVEFIITDQKARTGYYRFTKDAERIKKAFYRVLDRDSSIKAIAIELGFNTYQSMRKQLINPIWTGIRESSQKREKLSPGPDGKLRYRKVPRLVPIRTKINLQGEPLIPQTVFDEVQQVLGGINREHVNKRSGRSKFLLSGLLRCPCGERYYSRHDERDGKSGYYVCKSGYFKAAKSCGFANLNRAKTDEPVAELLSKTFANKAQLLRLLTVAATPNDHEEIKAERDEIQHKLDVLIQNRTKIIDNVAKGILSDEEVKISMAKIRSDLDKTKDRLSEIERRLMAVQIPNVGEVVKAVVSMFAKLKFQPMERQRTIIRKLIQEIQMGEDKTVSAVKLRLGDGQNVLISLKNPVTSEVAKAS